MSDNPGLAALAVISVIADTFDVPQEKVSPSTHVDDIAGWDSLGHSVLLVRLGRQLSLSIEEENAGFVDTVGELIARIEKLLGEAASVGLG